MALDDTLEGQYGCAQVTASHYSQVLQQFFNALYFLLTFLAHLRTKCSRQSSSESGTMVLHKGQNILSSGGAVQDALSDQSAKEATSIAKPVTWHKAYFSFASHSSSRCSGRPAISTTCEHEGHALSMGQSFQ